MPYLRNWTKNLLLLLIYLFSGGALVLIIDGLVTGTELSPFNTAVEETMVHLRTPLLTNLMVFITNLGSPFSLSIIAIFIAIYLLLNGDTFDAVLYIVSITFSILAFVVLKNTFVIPRPDHALIGLSSWSFPSGHATVSTAFFFATAYTFWGKLKRESSRLNLLIGSVFCVALICFTRIYLGAHWAIDILAGILLGLLTVSMTILIFNIFLEGDRWKLKFHRDTMAKN